MYLRPVGLSAGHEAEALLAAGGARRLAGGPFAFAGCEITLRNAGRTRATIATVAEIERWAEDLAAGQRDRVQHLFDRLTAPRPAAIGQPAIMGVVNVTPDSFSDGGAHLAPADAVALARRLLAEGAAILDIGGESTRPGAEPVPAEVERARVAPVLAQLAADRTGAAPWRLSIDTRNAAVMRAALDAGADIINDVSALTDDPESLALASASTATVVLMHKQGQPQDMNVAPSYDDAPLDIFDYLEARIAVCAAAGLPPTRLIVDPGIGFGKASAHNIAIMRALALFHGLGCPLLVGLSRKGLTGALDRRYPPGERLPGSIAGALWALGQGVQVLRAHDVAATRQAIEVWESLVALNVPPSGDG